MPARRPPTTQQARELAVVLHDLAWLLPRTVGAEASRAEPHPPTALEVMRLLSRRPGLSVNDVARELGIAANNVSTAVTYLEGQGLLERTRDPQDGRVIRLRPTADARAARSRREQRWAVALREALRAAAPADVDRLVAAIAPLRQLVDVLAVRDDPANP